jgi:hypothetical protein
MMVSGKRAASTATAGPSRSARGKQPALAEEHSSDEEHLVVETDVTPTEEALADEEVVRTDPLGATPRIAGESTAPNPPTVTPSLTSDQFSQFLGIFASNIAQRPQEYRQRDIPDKEKWDGQTGAPLYKWRARVKTEIGTMGRKPFDDDNARMQWLSRQMDSERLYRFGQHLELLTENERQTATEKTLYEWQDSLAGDQTTRDYLAARELRSIRMDKKDVAEHNASFRALADHFDNSYERLLIALYDNSLSREVRDRIQVKGETASTLQERFTQARNAEIQITWRGGQKNPPNNKRSHDDNTKQDDKSNRPNKKSRNDKGRREGGRGDRHRNSTGKTATLSDAEIKKRKEQKEKGLCYYCNVAWDPSHKCPKRPKRNTGDSSSSTARVTAVTTEAGKAKPTGT